MSLESAEIMIVANRQSPEGVELARYYARKRGIPTSQLLVLDLPAKETCGRHDYERKIATPVREYLAHVSPSWRIRCIVLVYGVPLRIRPVNTDQAPDVREFKARRRILSERIENQAKTDTPTLFETHRRTRIRPPPPQTVESDPGSGRVGGFGTHRGQGDIGTGRWVDRKSILPWIS